MIPKQKKLSRLTDMKALTLRKSEEFWRRLQESRLRKNVLETGLSGTIRRAGRNPLPLTIEETVARPTDTPTGDIGSSQSVKTKEQKTRGQLLKGLGYFHSTEEKNSEPDTERVRSNFGGEINLLSSSGVVQRRKFYHFSWRRSATPSLALFVGLGLLLLSLFPFLQNLEQDRQTSSLVLGAATSAYEEILSAQTNLLNADYQAANSDFSSAYNKFGQALSSLEDLSRTADLLPQKSQAETLLVAAKEATLAMQYLTVGAESLFRLRLGTDGLQGGARALTQLREGISNLKIAEKYFENAENLLGELDPALFPGDAGVKIRQMKQLLKTLRPGLASFIDLQELVVMVATGEKQYLLLFQNNRELRPTGGFIGTYGLLKVNEGRIADLKIETVYNPDGQLKEKIAAPGPLQRSLTKYWAMRDSNWFFDFPTSAQKVSEFYKKETGVSVDGVIAFTTNIFPKLLELTGPIYVPQYNVELTSENFVDEVQYQTSEVYDRELNQPKKFLADFAPLLLERISRLDREGQIKFLELVLKALQDKDILLFSFDAAKQSRIEDFGWSGRVKFAKRDYLAVVHTNVGAGKTDQNIVQTVNLNSKVMPDGSVLNTLRIIRTHIPGREKEFPVNVDFMRIYVPAGSRLVSASGFENFPFYPSVFPGAASDPELQARDRTTLVDGLTNTLIYQANGKTVFANWLVLAPGETKEVQLEYRLPFQYNLSDNSAKVYTLLAQKQPGSATTEFTSTLVLPDGARVILARPTGEITTERDKLEFESKLTTDEFWGAVFR